jgi:ubiquinone/menaquinone biosynthesis C-methylase UbiE
MSSVSSAESVLPRAHDNRVRGPFNSWILGVLEGHFHRRLGPTRQEVLSQVAGEVLEIGAGNGPTLRYLPASVARLHAVEPNRHFHDRLRRAATEHGFDLVLHDTPGETLDLPDASMDAAIVSWVLCTVAEPDRVLGEVRRVLRPGGRFVFIEHVHAPEGSAVRAVQHAVARPWRWLFEGCHTTRDTAAAIHRAGFRSVEIEPVRVATPFVPIRTQIAGIATA